MATICSLAGAAADALEDLAEEIGFAIETRRTIEHGDERTMTALARVVKMIPVVEANLGGYVRWLDQLEEQAARDRSSAS